MKRILGCILALGFVHTLSFAEEAGKMDAAKQEMMKKWQAYATPSKGHKVFEGMVGKWKYTSKWWEGKDAKPQESNGSSNIKLVMGGRFLQHDTKGKSMGQPFVGMGFTGYDNVTEKYDSVWMDNMGTGMMIGQGKFDEETKTLKDEGKFSCPMVGKSREYRSEWKLNDKNSMTFTMWGPDKEGDEFKMMELSFQRVKEVTNR
jgi:hypothetical protein